MVSLQQYLQQKGLISRFEERAIAWAEKLQVRWIELEGELWTLVSELERKKGVEPGDFTTHAKLTGLSGALLEKSGEPPTALQRLLQVAGVKRGSIPTAFQVEGGYALSCGGPTAKAGITGLVRQQVPEWALAGYTLINVPLALSYLMHGRSEVAKATRDLTIGTTMDVGRVAAAQQNTPLATLPFSTGISPEILSLLARLNECIAEQQAAIADQASRAELKADDAKVDAAEAKADAAKALHTVNQFSQVIKTREKISKPVRRQVIKLWQAYFANECPCCHKQVTGEQGTMEVDHFWNSSNALENLWYVCKSCNHRMGKPGPHRDAKDKTRHNTWLDRCGLQAVQPDLFA